MTIIGPTKSSHLNCIFTSMDKMTWTEPSSGQWPAKVWGKTTCALGTLHNVHNGTVHNGHWALHMCTGHWAGYRVQCACRGVIGQIKGRLFQLIHQTIWLKLARQDIFFLLHLIVNSQFSFLRVQLFSMNVACTRRCSSRANAGGRATCAELDITFRHIV